MFSKFLNMEIEKQTKILNAALKEFAHKGYKNASTNEIVKDAGISKGLLFHYFKNKRELFVFLYDYCLEVLIKDFYSKVDLEEKDIIARLKQFSMVKIKMLEKYPDIMRFIETAYMEDSIDVKNEIESRNDGLADKNLTKAFEGIGNAEIKRAKLDPSSKIDYLKVFKDGEIYIEMFKKWFYK